MFYDGPGKAISRDGHKRSERIKRDTSSPTSHSRVYYDSLTWVWHTDAKCISELIHFYLAHISTAALPHHITSCSKLGQTEFLTSKLIMHSLDFLPNFFLGGVTGVRAVCQVFNHNVVRPNFIYELH